MENMSTDVKLSFELTVVMQWLDQQRAQEQVLEALPLVSEVNAMSEELNKHKYVLLGHLRENVLSKKFLHFGNSPVIFFRISYCCYGYCDQFCDWWI